jgi:hypothetical protein
MSWKVCTGPAHPQPVRLPVDEAHWHYHRSGPLAGQPVARCKLCQNWAKLQTKAGAHGLVPASRVRQLTQELVDRCDGYRQVEQRHGIAESTLRGLLAGQARVQKTTAQRILQALDQQRREDRRNGASARFIKARQRQAVLEGRLTRLAGY